MYLNAVVTIILRRLNWYLVIKDALTLGKSLRDSGSSWGSKTMTSMPNLVRCVFKRGTCMSFVP